MLINRARSLAILGLIVLAIAGQRTVRAQNRGPVGPRIPAEALAQARARGNTRVIVGLDVNFTPEPLLEAAAGFDQRASISRAQATVLSRMLRVHASTVRRFSSIPFLALEVDEGDLQALAASPDVAGIEIDALARPTLAESTPLVGATRAWAAGYTGAGWTVAVLDTGVDATHPFLNGKVVSEACYSTTSDFDPTTVRRSNSVCPGGVASSTAPGSAAPCALTDCLHGTHVAGIAAGRGNSFSGVARDASLIAIQVFSSFTTSTDCDSPAPCALSFTSDQILALEHVYDLRTTYNIAAVNMSLGGADIFTSPCDNTNNGFIRSTKAIIDQLRAAGIATVIASGNGSSVTGLSAPACISTAISVASTTDGTPGSGTPDRVSDFSNTNQYLSFFAPGETILSSVPGGGFVNLRGTSMAAPHVAGAWAIMKSGWPSAGVTQIADTLSATGTPIVDPGNGITKPRINIDLALQLVPVPCTYAVSPSRVTAGPQAGTATITVTTAANCPWTALSLSSFIILSAGQNGIGPGTVVADYAENSSQNDREGTLDVAGSTVTIAQRRRPAQPDVNSDGRTDLIWQHLTQGSLGTWYLDGWNVVGTSFLSINRVADTNWRVVGSGDLNGDGHTDLVWQHRTAGWLGVWFLSGTDVISTPFLSINRITDLNWEVRGVGDLDGDGKADLIWQHRTEGSVGAWLMNGEQVVSTRLLSIGHIADTNWEIAGAGDTNGDGYADLVWQHRTDGRLGVWSMRGTDVIGTGFLNIDHITDLNWHIRGVGDVDADGQADLLWQNDATGEVGVWTLNGSVVVNQHTLSIDRVADLNWRIVGPG